MMKARLAAVSAALSALVLNGCDSGGAEPPEGPSDTSFEQAAPNPVPGGDTAAEPVPDNTSAVSGPDERADAILDYDSTSPAREPADAAVVAD